MKKLLFAFSALLICFACNEKADTTASNEKIETIDPMVGVWEQTNYYYLVHGDTVYSDDNAVQHKFYLDSHVI